MLEGLHPDTVRQIQEKMSPTERLRRLGGANTPSLTSSSGGESGVGAEAARTLSNGRATEVLGSPVRKNGE